MKIDFSSQRKPLSDMSDLEAMILMCGSVNYPTLLRVWIDHNYDPSELMEKLSYLVDDGSVIAYAPRGKMTTYSIGGRDLETAESQSVKVDEDESPETDQLMDIVIKNWEPEAQFTVNGIFKKASIIDKRWRKDKVNTVVDKLISEGRIIKVREGKYMGKKFWFLRSKD